VAAFLSTVNGSLTRPWPGLGVYAASKAALETMVEAWRVEHPDVGFTTVIVGDCAGGEGASTTEFTANWDMGLAAEFHPIWQARNLLGGSLIAVEELVAVVDLVLRCGASASIPSVAVTPRSTGSTAS
jgi:NAD(P)-dependent dehydrogenase (short-subunit alcohol dehydrogenase family)